METRTVWMSATAVLLMALAASVLGGSNDEFERSENGARSEPVLQMGGQVGYRLDDLNKYDYVPSLGGQFYYFFHPMIALRAGFAHNSLTRLSDEISYHSVVGDLVLRVNTSQSRVSPFLESGFSFPYVWGVNRGYEYSDLQPGVQVGVGLSLRLSGSLAFDLSVNQIVNHWNTEVEAVLSPGITESAPCPIGENCLPLRQNPDGAFNPALIELAFRFGL